MTLLINHYGVVYQKDLGSTTAAIAAGISEYTRCNLEQGHRLAKISRSPFPEITTLTPSASPRQASGRGA
jgi:hypothetical protein